MTDPKEAAIQRLREAFDYAMNHATTRNLGIKECARIAIEQAVVPVSIKERERAIHMAIAEERKCGLRAGALSNPIAAADPLHWSAVCRSEDGPA